MCCGFSMTTHGRNQETGHEHNYSDFEKREQRCRNIVLSAGVVVALSSTYYGSWGVRVYHRKEK
jgi:hypothetical protein